VRRPRLRRPSPRLPVIVLLAGAIGGAVAQARIDDDRAADAAEDGTKAADSSAVPVGSMPTVAGEDVLASTWYCAAGTGDGGGMADHTVAMLNPSDQPLDATVTVYGGVLASAGASAAAAPAPVQREVRLPARDRVELRLGDVVAAPLVAALVEVDGGGVAVDHGVSGPHGSDAGPCASGAAPEWHLASGATTRDAREVVALFNPFHTDAIIDVAFDTDAGSREPLRFQGFPVPAGTVVGVDIGDDVAREAQVSATLRVRTGRLVVERLQSFDGSLGPKGLSLALGVPEPSTTWAFADGTVDEAQTERIVVYNPGDDRAEVDVSVLPTTEEPALEPQPFRLSIPAGDFSVVDYGAEDRVPVGVAHATLVRSTNGVPVVADRVLTQTVGADEEGEDSESVGDTAAGPGAPLAAHRWTFPSPVEGDGSDARFVVFNPDPERSTRVTLLEVADGREAEIGTARDVEVPAGGRVTLTDETDEGDEPSDRVPASAWVVQSEAPVVAERVVLGADGLRLATELGLPSVDGAALLPDEAPAP
jgi:hypothetical protein